MAKTIKTLINTGNEETSKLVDVVLGSGANGKPTRIKAIKGARYQLQDQERKDAAPEKIRSKRVGKNLHVSFDGAEEADLIVENYYEVNTSEDTSAGLFGRAEDGGLYEYIPEDPVISGSVARLKEGGNAVSQVLGGGALADEFVLSALPLVAAAGGFNPLLAGGALLAAAAAGGGGGGGTTAVVASKPVAPVSPVVTDNVGTKQGALVSGDKTDDNKPVFSGKGTAGNVVKVYDGENVIASTTVKSDGTWSVQPTAPLTNGNHSFSTTETNSAGEGPKSAPVAVVVAVPPAAPTVVEVLDDAGEVKGNLKTGDNTDDTTPTVNGKGVPGDVVKLYDGDKVVGSATVKADGTWSITPTLANGQHKLTVTQTDAIGESAKSDPVVLSVVNGAPAAPSNVVVTNDNDPNNPVNVQPGSPTNDTTPKITGKGTPGSVVKVFDNGKEVGSTTVGDDGNWSVKPNPPLTEGEHKITAVTEDPVTKKQSTPTGEYPITVDVTPPDAPSMPEVTDDVGQTTGKITANSTTDDASPVITGTGTAGDKISVWDNGTLLGTTTVGTDGKWSLTPTTPLSNGAHSITVKATDPANNTSAASPALPFNVDTSAVAVAIIKVVDNVGSITNDVPNNGVTDDATPTLVGTATAYAVVTIKEGNTVLGQATANAKGEWLFTTVAQSEGAHTYTAEVTTAGNTQSSRITVVVDTTAPTSPNVVVTDNAGTKQGVLASGDATDDSTPVISGKGEKQGDIITVYDGDKVIGSTTVKADGTWSMKPEKPLAEGNHALSVTETDKAGNVSPKSTPINIVVDFTPPNVAVPNTPSNVTVINDNDPANPVNVQPGSQTNDNTPKITGKGKPGEVVKVYDNGTEVGSSTVNEDGTWSVTPKPPLSEGDHKITTKSVDPVTGKTSTPSGEYPITVDTTPPATPAIPGANDDAGQTKGDIKPNTTTDDVTPEIKGVGEKGNVITVYDNGQPIGSTTVKPDGTWSFTPTKPLANGEHSITVTETDQAKNTSPASPALVFTVDNSAINVAITKIVDNVGSITTDVANNGVTDDTTPTLVGTAKANAVVTIKDGSTVLGSVTANANGEWSFTPATAQTEGAHIYTAEVTNAGNTQTSSFAVVVDTTAPSAPRLVVTDNAGTKQGKLASNDSTDDSMPVISGKGESGDVVKVYDGATLIGSTTVKSDGNWSFKPTSPLSEGKHTLSVTETDPAGNVSEKSAPFNLVVDTSIAASSAPVVKITTDSNDNGYVNTRELDASNGKFSVEVSFDSTKVEVGDKLIVTDGTTTRAIVLTQADVTKGLVSMTFNAPNEDQALTVTATLEDTIGNVSRQGYDSAILDRVTPPGPPSAMTLYDDVGDLKGFLSNNDSTDDAQPTLSGKAGEDAAFVRIYDGDTLIASVAVNSDGSWSYTPANALLAGTHSFRATSVDDNDMESAKSAPINFSIVGSLPAAPAITLVNDDMGEFTGPIAKDGTTDDTKPTVSGTGVPGTTVKLYDGAKEIGTAVVDSNGSWSITPAAALSEGAHSLTAKTVDSIGQVSPATGEYKINVDTTAPAKPGTAVQAWDDQGQTKDFIANNGTTDDANPEFKGTGTPGNVIKVFDGATELGTAVVGSDGNWSFTPSTPLGNGPHSITYSERDGAGNNSEKSPALNFTVDTSAVTVSITKAVDDFGTVKGDVSNNGTTNDTTPTLVGKSTANAVVTIKEGTTVLGSVTADANGNWTFTPGAQAEGKHTYSAYVTIAGNTTSSEFVLSIDTTAPSTPSDIKVNDDVGVKQGEIKSGDSTDDTTPTVNGSGGTPGDVVKVYDGENVIGSAVVGQDGKWSVTPTSPLSEGEHKLSVTETDPHGNESPKSPETKITVDTTAPVAVSELKLIDDVGLVVGEIKTTNPVTSTDDTKPTLSGKAPADAKFVNIYDGNTLLDSVVVNSDGTWSYTPVAGLSSGSHALSATTVDSAKNESAKSAAITFNVVGALPTAPAITLVNDDMGEITGSIAKDGTTDDTKPTVSGTGTAGTTVKLYDGTTEIGSAVVGTDGTWTITPAAALSEGAHSLTAKTVDSIGQVSPATGEYKINVDTTAPAKPGTAVQAWDDQGQTKEFIANNGTTDDANPEFKGTGTPGNVIKVFDGATELGTAVVGSDGNWSFTPSTPLGNGPHSITYSERDGAGNNSEKSPALNFTVDTSAVTVSITKAVDDFGTVKGDVSNNGTTNDTTPTLVGKSTANAVVTIKEGTTVLGSVTADANGNWTFTPGAQAEGKHTYSAYVTIAGNTTSSEFVLSIDTTAPSTPNPILISDDVGAKQVPLVSGDSTDDTTPTLSGTGTPGDVVKVYDGENVIGSAVVGQDGKWSVTPTSPLSEGEHKLSVTETDPHGNESPKSPETKITVDTTAPVAVSELKLIDDVGLVVGEIKTTNPVTSTDDTKPTLSGKAPADAKFVNIYDGNTLLDSVVVNSDGTWSYTPVAGLSSGSHALSATTVDSAKNESAKSAAITFNVVGALPTAPAITLVNDDMGEITGSIAKDGTTDDTKPTVSGTGTAGTTVKLYDGTTEIGSAVVGTDGTWTITPAAALSEGAHSLTAKTVDSIGQVSPATGEYKINVDTTAPAKPGTAVQAWDDQGQTKDFIANNGTTDDANPEFKGTGTPGNVIKVFDGATELGTAVVGSDGNWSFTPSTPLGNGPHSITYSERDGAGNNSEKSPALNFTVDTSAVTVSITKAVDDFGTVKGDVSNNGTTNDTTPTLVGKSTANAVVTIKEGTTVLGSVTADANGNWTFTPGAQAEGKHTYSAYVTIAGNTTSSEFVLSIDTTAPSTPSDIKVNDDVGVKQGEIKSGDSTDDTTPTVNGSGGTPGDVVKVYDGENVIGSAVVGQDGKWSVTPTSPLAQGEHKLSVTETDPHGNESSKSPETKITVDTTGPKPVPPTDDPTKPAAGQTGLVIDKVTADNTVNLVESKGNVTITGKAYGDFTAGDVVTLRVKGVDASGTVAADGSFSVNVAGSNLAVDSDFAIEASLVAHDKAGNPGTITAKSTYNVDLTAPNGNVAPEVTITTDSNDDGYVNAKELIAANNAFRVSASFDNTKVEVGDIMVFSDGTTTKEVSLTQNDIDNGFAVTSFAKPAENASLAVTAFVKDVAGNATPVSVVDTAMLDTNAPNTGKAPVVKIVNDVDNNGIIDPTEIASDDIVYVDATFDKGSAVVGDKLMIKSGETTVTFTLTQADINAGVVSTTFEKPADGSALDVTSWMQDPALNTTAVSSNSATVSTVLTLHGTTAYNLHAVAANIGTLTEVDMVADAGVNTVKLSLSDVLGVAKVGAIPTLKLTGTATDFAEVGLANWTHSSSTPVESNGHTYEVFNSSVSGQTAQLLIDQAMWNANHVI